MGKGGSVSRFCHHAIKGAITGALALAIGAVSVGCSPAKANPLATEYAAGNGYPSSIVSYSLSWPRNYYSVNGERLLYLIPKPDPALIAGLEEKTLEDELTLLMIQREDLKTACQSAGLLDSDEAPTDKELRAQVQPIFDQLTGYYGAKKELPKLILALDEPEFDGHLLGAIDRDTNTIVMYKQLNLPDAIASQVHEESHEWVDDEALNSLATEENLIRMADRFGMKYLYDPTDRASGRSACLYGEAANKELANDWYSILLYLRKDKVAKPDAIEYYVTLEYSVIPGLVMRYTTIDGAVTQPILKTNSPYTIDLSQTQGRIKGYLNLQDATFSSNNHFTP